MHLGIRILALLLLLAGCARSGGDLPLLPARVDGYYRLDTGDRLRVTVFGQPNLSAEYGVGDTGHLSMPLLGLVPARGLTAYQLETRVGQQLQAGGFVSNPSVSVELVANRPFFILGEVQKPGQYPYLQNMSVISAVAIGGGFTHRAETEIVTVTRQGPRGAIDYKGVRGSPLLPGDVVYVKKRLF